MPRTPPVTPSPHRFLAEKCSTSSPSKVAQERSGLREQALQTIKQPQNPIKQAPQPSQFAPTPRFSSSKAKARHVAHHSPSPPKPAVVQAVRRNVRRIEDVDDAFNHIQDDEMLDDELAHALMTTEQDPNDTETNYQWSDNLAFSPKRRRLDAGVSSSTSVPTFRPPGPPASHVTRVTPHLTETQTRTTQTSLSVEQFESQRPSFLRSSVAPQETSEPLPETFSPHKRGHRFVPGGMAATVQQWVIETGQAATQRRKGQAYLEGEDYVSRVKVGQIIGEGPFTIHGKHSNGTIVKMVLAGESHVSEGKAHAVGTDCIVGIRAPTWELELDDEHWTVAVDWRVLS